MIAPAGEMWSVVIESPSIASGRAPWMSLSVTGASGVVQTVQFAAKDARVYCRRGEEDTVFEIDTDDLFRLREPVTSFLEPNFVRFEREGLTEVLLGRGERSVRLRAAGPAGDRAEVRRVHKWLTLNYLAVLKITKKHDKHMPYKDYLAERPVKKQRRKRKNKKKRGNK